MPIYHAYEILSGDTADMWVDTDPAALLLRMSEDLMAAEEAGGIEEISVGTVEAANTDRAIDEVRAGRWLPGRGRAEAPHKYLRKKYRT
jgi:hypothetical protein